LLLLGHAYIQLGLPPPRLVCTHSSPPPWPWTGQTHARPTLCNLVQGHRALLGVVCMSLCLGHHAASRRGFLDRATCPRYTVRSRGSPRTGQTHVHPTLFNLVQGHWVPIGVPYIRACFGLRLGPAQDGFGPNHPPCDFAVKSDPRPGTGQNVARRSRCATKR
jgi:hypothetical protein